MFQQYFVGQAIKISICIAFTLAVCANVYFNYTNWIIRKENFIKSDNLSYLQQNNSFINEQKEYFSSDEYKQKLFKQEGLKRKNEIVIEMGIDETLLERDQTNYIPETQTKHSNTFSVWFSCFFATTESTSSTTSYCK